METEQFAFKSGMDEREIALPGCLDLDAYLRRRDLPPYRHATRLRAIKPQSEMFDAGGGPRFVQ